MPPLHFVLAEFESRLQSPSGQDVASWPRQPGVDTGLWLSMPACSCEVCACVSGIYIFHDLLVRSRDIATRHVTVVVDNTDRRRSADDLGLLVPLRIFREVFYSRSTSSSGQGVALWPRQPRFKSWCGHRLLALLADMLTWCVGACLTIMYFMTCLLAPVTNRHCTCHLCWTTCKGGRRLVSLDFWSPCIVTG